MTRAISIILIFVSVGCASSIKVRQKSCPKTMTLLGPIENITDSNEELLWMPAAPFSSVEYDLLEDERCSASQGFTLTFQDTWSNVLLSFIPFIGHSKLFLNR